MGRAGQGRTREQHEVQFFFWATPEQAGALRTVLHSGKFAGFAIGRMGEASKTIAQSHTMVTH